MDVRIAIGIGSEEFKSDNIREADGTAYQNSGKLLDSIMEKQILLALKSPWKDFDEEMQVSFALAEALINGWSYKSAEIAWWMLRGETTQKELSNILKISQPAVHKRIQRVYYDELKMLEWRFRNKIIKLNK
jgi:predicted HTH transcriptional regulator